MTWAGAPGLSPSMGAQCLTQNCVYNFYRDLLPLGTVTTCPAATWVQECRQASPGLGPLRGHSVTSVRASWLQPGLGPLSHSSDASDH